MEPSTGIQKEAVFWKKSQIWYRPDTLIKTLLPLIYDNLFDREYFPSGMFNADADAVIEVFMDPTEKGVNAGLQHLKSTFQDKYVAAE